MDARYVAAGSSGFAEQAQVARRPRSRLGRWAALAFATLVVATLAFAARADAFVYWANSDLGRIGRANLDGTGVNQSFITGAGAGGVAVDGAHVYWTSGAGIGRANLDGTGANQSFIAAPIGPSQSFFGGPILHQSVAVDGAHVYWVSKFGDPRPPGSLPLIGAPGTGAIGRANLDGTGVDANFISGITFPAGGLAADGSHLYWTSYDPQASIGMGPPFTPAPYPARIGRANLNGTGVEESFILDAPAASLAVDDTHVWWVYSAPFGSQGAPSPSAALFPTSGIQRANLDGTGAEFVVEPARRFNKSFDICGIAVKDTHVYWTEDESIGRANLDGSRATHELITGTQGCGGVALDALGPPPSNKFSFGGAKANKKRGSAKLTVQVAGPGEVRLAKTGSVKGQRKRAAQSGKAKLTVKAKGKAKKRLNKRGKTTVKAKVTYTPDGGASDTKSKKIRLVKR